VRLLFCGVRGSTPAPGREFVRYGGHTSALAIAHGADPPSLVLDGGTGLRRLSRELGEQPFRGSVLLGHLHWDHVQGLPFFGAGTRPGHRVDVALPAPAGDPVATLARGLSPPHFPIGPRELGGGWSFRQLIEGTRRVEDFQVLAREIPHKGGQTFGFRVSDGVTSFAYLSDHWPIALGPGADGLGELHEAALTLADGVDVLIHDSQYLADEFPRVASLGHASVEYACSLAAAAGARALLLFHHSPERTDEQLDSIVANSAGGPVPVSAAYEGLQLDLPGQPDYSVLPRAAHQRW
jgi:ribonuclease BN (tRNA processing enzyme)